VDTVDGFVRAAEADDVTGKVFNLGTGQEISIGDLAATIQSLLGTDLPIVADDARASRGERSRAAVRGRVGGEALWTPAHRMEDGLTRPSRG
jgi:nucleoside-diphosphate-sugar epimerase